MVRTPSPPILGLGSKFVMRKNKRYYFSSSPDRAFGWPLFLRDSQWKTESKAKPIPVREVQEDTVFRTMGGGSKEMFF